MSTMREEFEAVFRESFKSDADFAGDEWSYHDLSVDNAWDLWCAAYAAGQRAATEQAAKVCDVIADEHWNAYKGRIEPIDKGRLFNPHTEGISDGADQCAAAIRARDKEQGC